MFVVGEDANQGQNNVENMELRLQKVHICSWRGRQPRTKLIDLDITEL